MYGYACHRNSTNVAKINSSIVFISLLDLCISCLHGPPLPHWWARKNRETKELRVALPLPFLPCHNFSLSVGYFMVVAWIRIWWGILGHLCFLECHCLLLCSKQVPIWTEAWPLGGKCNTLTLNSLCVSLNFMHRGCSWILCSGASWMLHGRLCKLL